MVYLHVRDHLGGCRGGRGDRVNNLEWWNKMTKRERLDLTKLGSLSSTKPRSEV